MAKPRFSILRIAKGWRVLDRLTGRRVITTTRRAAKLWADAVLAFAVDPQPAITGQWHCYRPSKG